MSVKVLTRVWNHSTHKRSERLVLLAIADHCSADDGSGAWPSQATIAAKTGLTDRYVRMILTRLVESGELTIDERPGKSGRYTVNVTPEPSSDPCGCFGCTHWKRVPTTPEVSSGQGGRKFLPPRKPASYEPSLTVPNPKEPSTSEDAAQSAAEDEQGTGLQAGGARPGHRPRRDPVPSGDAFQAWRDRFAIRHGRWPTPDEEVAASQL